MAFPSDKVPGYYKLPMSITKDTLPCNFPIVMDNVYRRLLTSVFPTAWKISEIIPLPKEGDHDVANNMQQQLPCVPAPCSVQNMWTCGFNPANFLLEEQETPHWATKREQEVTFSWDTERQKELSPVPSEKDHGVQVDDTLSYDEHITNTVSTRIARLSLINRVNYIFDTQTLLNIINALVRSKLYYNCSSVWGGGDSHIKRAGMLVGKFQMNP